MLVLGLVSAMALFWYLAKRTRVNEKVFGFYGTLGIISIGLGLFGAWLFQLFYEMVAFFNQNGTLSGFPVTADGFTFMGGLVLGALTFVLGTFLFARKNIKREFWRVLGLAVPCLALALAFGRMGCFFAGCCFGVRAEWGILFPSNLAPNHSVIPTNLFEAIFSMLLCVAMVYLILRHKKGNFNVYIFGFGYAIWRFIIEFWRGDESRQAIFALSPSQIQSIVLFVVVLALAIMVFTFKLIPFRLGKALEVSGQGAVGSKHGEVVESEQAVVATNDHPIEAEASSGEDFYVVANEDSQGEDSFYTAQETKTQNEKTSPTYGADAKYKSFCGLVKYIFIGGLGLGALFAIIGFILLGLGNHVPMAFLFTFSVASLVIASASMPLPTPDFFKAGRHDDKYYNAGFSIMGRAFGKHKQEQ